ncbi:MAG: hypothetical protein IJU16_07280 [Clostridia bacterium]|nr:hypothetical protein [Clostridia bacterium]
MEKVVFFIGHADTPDAVYPALCEAVEEAISAGIMTFYVGHYGAFDRLVTRALRESKERVPAIRLYLVLPFHPAMRPVSLSDGFDGSIYPFDDCRPPYRAAIVAANHRMIDRCDRVIAYAYRTGKARDFLEYAQKKAGVVVNLAMPNE